MQRIGAAWERSLQRPGIENCRFHNLWRKRANWHLMSGSSLQELMELEPGGPDTGATQESFGR